MMIVDGDIPQYWLTGYEKVFALDIETSGLDRNHDRIACVQVHNPVRGTIIVRRLTESPTELIRLLESTQRKIFHHAPFDLGFLLRDYPNMAVQNIADTKIAAGILDPTKKRFGSHSLKYLVKHYFNYDMDKTLAVSNWFAETLSPKQVDYAIKDVEFLPRLLSRLEQAIRRKGLYGDLQRAYQHIPTSVLLSLKKEGI